MIKDLITKKVKVKVSFSNRYNGYNPEEHTGTLIDVCDNFIKLKVETKKENQTIIISRTFLISMIEL